MNKLVSLLSQAAHISKNDRSIIAFSLNVIGREVRVQVDGDYFKDVVDDLGIKPSKVEAKDRGEYEYPTELSVSKGKVVFFTILERKEYEQTFKAWIDEDESLETERAQADLTEYERKLKESGHVEGDFS